MIWFLLACAEGDVPGRIPVTPPEEGVLSASVWVQGNSSFVVGAQVCHEQSCAETGEDGFADLFDLPPGPLTLTVDNADGEDLLVPLNLVTNYVSRWAVRSFSPWVLPDWLGPMQSGTGVIMVFPGDAGEQTVTLEGAVLASSVGEVLAVHDFQPAVPEDTARGESFFFLMDLPPGEVELWATHPEGACTPKSMGWPGSASDSFIVPVEADRVTAVNLECVRF